MSSRSRRLLTAAAAVSGTGSQVSSIALPAVAITVSGADAGTYGLLTSLSAVASLLLLPFAGVLVDRKSPRSVSIWANVACGLASLSIPLLYLSGRLDIWPLGVATLLVAISAVFSRVGEMSLPPFYETRGSQDLVKLNGYLATSDSTLNIVGPPMAATVVAILRAPLAILIDAASFFLAAGILVAMPRTANKGFSQHRAPWWNAAWYGMKYVFQNHPIRWTALTTAGANLAFSLNYVALTYFLLSQLTSTYMGVVFMIGGCGGVLGAFLAPRIGGSGTGFPLMIFGLLALAAAYMASGPLALLLSRDEWPIVGLLAACAGVADFGMVVYNIYSVSIRQRLCDPELLGRATASVRLISRASTLIGTGAAGYLVGVLGAPTVLILAGAVAAAVALVAALARPRASIALFEPAISDSKGSAMS
ncbi:MFS transporter [Streptomyces sp. ME19-03-3]|nr:MFS transporter [Streptomyces sp. ME19-03-3]